MYFRFLKKLFFSFLLIIMLSNNIIAQSLPHREERPQLDNEEIIRGKPYRGNSLELKTNREIATKENKPNNKQQKFDKKEKKKQNILIVVIIIFFTASTFFLYNIRSK